MLKQEKIDILQKVVQIKSVNGNEEEVALYLQSLLQQHDIDSTVIPYAEGRSN